MNQTTQNMIVSAAITANLEDVHLKMTTRIVKNEQKMI